MTDVDAALQWAQSNPEHPQAQAVMAKAWAIKNPNDPRSSQILAKIGQAAQQSANPQSLPDAADKAAQGNNPRAMPTGNQGHQFKPLNPLPNDPYNIEGLNKINKVVHDQGPEMLQAIAGASPGLQKLPEFAAKPINKLADYLMQKAVGLKKYLPGIGNELVDQGLIGTKNMMSNQVDTRLPLAEQKLQEAVKSITGTAPASEIANAVSSKGQRFILPSGEVPSNVLPELTKVRSASEGLSSLGSKTGGELSAPDLLSLKRQGNWLGYTAAGNPASSLEAELGNTQASAAKTALDRLTSGASSDALRTEEALVKAKKTLNRPDSLSKPLGFSGLMDIPGSSLGLSTAAQASQKLLAPSAKIATNPLLLEGLFNKDNSSGK